MNYIKLATKLSVFFFIFSLNFAQMDFLNLGYEFLLTRISIFLLLAISLINFKSSYSIKHFSRYLTPILIYFAYLTLIGVINQSSMYQNYFDFYVFIDILIFWILLNYSIKYKNILLKGLLVFVFSSFILSLLYFSGISVNEELEGRHSIFGINANMLGIEMCVSLLILISIIFENRLELGKKRFLLLFLFPFQFNLMILTGSRVAAISFVLGLGTYLYYVNHIGRLKKILLLVFSSSLFVLFWQIFLKNSYVAERIFDTVNEGDLSTRDLIWISLFDLISNNYVFGVGKTGYSMRVGEGSPHNVFLEVLCYTGIIGLIIFLIFYFRIIQNGYRKMKSQGELLSLVLVIPILGLVLSGQIFDQKIVWVIFAYIASSMVLKDSTDKLHVK